MCRLNVFETGDQRPQRSATSLAKRASPPLFFHFQVLERLDEEAEPQVLRISWIEIMIQAFGDIMDGATESLPIADESIKVEEIYT